MGGSGSNPTTTPITGLIREPAHLHGPGDDSSDYSFVSAHVSVCMPPPPKSVHLLIGSSGFGRTEFSIYRYLTLSGKSESFPAALGSEDTIPTFSTGILPGCSAHAGCVHV